jgi:hypothetical protein
MPRILLALLLIFAIQPRSVAPVAAADACPGALPISDVRSAPLGGQATVHGHVTVATGVITGDQSFALQDETGGIYVYRQRGVGQELAEGDELCVTGMLKEYHGLLEIIPASPGQIVRLGAGNPLEPRAIPPTQIGEVTEGQLVSITGQVSWLGAKRFRVGGTPVYLAPDIGSITLGVVEGCQVTVTGLSADYDGAQIWPRGQADIIPGGCLEIGCGDFTVAHLQGRGTISPYDGQDDLSCLSGCITGVGAKGFYIQSPVPDADPLTSEGTFVFRHSDWNNPRGLSTGDLVEIYDFAVQEYYGATEIVGLEWDSDAHYRVVGSCDLPEPQPVPPLIDPEVEPESIYEPYEGMRVSMSFDG